MTDTTFGPEIAVNGKRPDWLEKPCVSIGYQRSDSGWYGPIPSSPKLWQERHITISKDGWSNVIAIRLPADHFAYKALDAGFEPWPGGDAAPADWDGGAVLCRRGDSSLLRCAADSEQWRDNIIGYHKRTPAAATPAGTVTIARMTEAEALRLWRGSSSDAGSAEHFAYLLKRIGVIPTPKPETTAERFTRETGHELPSDMTPAMRSLFEAALAWERGK